MIRSIWAAIIARTPSLKVITRVAAGLAIAMLPVLGFGYWKLSHFVDARLANGASGESTMLYSAPTVISVGDTVDRESLVKNLQLAGYTSDPHSGSGYFAVNGETVLVKPGRDCYFRDEPVSIRFDGGHIAELTAVKTKASIADYALEPQPLVRLEDGALQKRRPVHFSEIPPVLVDSLLAAEDKHFFHHAGFDALRLVKAAWINVRTNRKEQGGSTLTMQLARNLYLDADKNWKRKFEELLIAETLELKLSKQEIFEYYVNQVYLGRRNTAGVHGFGQAAMTYFGKNLSEITLSEAAMLAGLVQRPSYFDPVRHPDRAVARRNVVLGLMTQNKFITEAQRAQAAEQPLQLAPRVESPSDAPWFVELAMDDLQSHEGVPSGGNVYTTLDPVLQRAALDAVKAGLREVDQRVGKHKEHGLPQVALVALDPHTGEVKALVGGRDFGQSQVNHATAMRQPGSVFKPFVYAAALEASGKKTFSPATVLVDAPTTFRFEGQDYRPSNFGEQFHGSVTMRNALAKSMNIATVSLAQQVGYDKVLNLAKQAGFNDGLKATPALALGAYEATPVEVGGAYTVFANDGEYVKPTFLSEARTPSGHLTFRSQPESHRVLDSPVAFLMQDLLTEVLRSGTGASVHSRGLNVPAAGKTGTSRDGWFAGYVSNLICVVWVGFDDNHDLDIEGAKSALPIWVEFMKRAAQRSPYRQALEPVPPGVISVAVDPGTGLLAGADCVNKRREYFIRGTEPRRTCTHEDTLPFSESSPIQPVAFGQESSQ